MIIIKYTGKRNNIQIAVEKANRLLRSREFYERISLHPFFDNTDVAPYIIANLIKKTTIKMNIRFYYSQPRSKAHSFDDSINPRNIQVNVWTMERSVPSLCDTMLHACVHAVNAENPKYNFGHTGINENDAANTAPYWIGNLAQKMISGDEAIDEISLHEENTEMFKIFECMVLPVS